MIETTATAVYVDNSEEFDEDEFYNDELLNDLAVMEYVAEYGEIRLRKMNGLKKYRHTSSP